MREFIKHAFSKLEMQWRPTQDFDLDLHFRFSYLWFPRITAHSPWIQKLVWYKYFAWNARVLKFESVLNSISRNKVWVTEKFQSEKTMKISREINTIVIFPVKMLLSRNLLSKQRESFLKFPHCVVCNHYLSFHESHICVVNLIWKSNKKAIMCLK